MSKNSRKYTTNLFFSYSYARQMIPVPAVVFKLQETYFYRMILVTGGTGLVGSHLLLHLLRAGKKVRALYRSAQNREKVKHIFLIYCSPEEASELFNRIEWFEGEINDIPVLERAFEDILQVYHCAALISFDPSRDILLRKVNIEGTANVVNLCIQYNIKKLMYVSSIATLDPQPGETEITETSYWNKEIEHSMYAITKYGAEMEVWRASQEGVPVIILNPGVILGPGFWRSGSGEIFHKIAHGLNYYFPKVTGFVGVEDVARILTELGEAPVQNEQFIVVSENASFKDVLALVAKGLGRSAPRRQLTPLMIRIGWILEYLIATTTRKERKLQRSSSRSLFLNSYYSSQKILSTLNFKFTPLDAVISSTARIYNEEVPNVKNPGVK